MAGESSIERIGAVRRGKAGVVERQAFVQLGMRGAAGFLKPDPDILCPFGAVTWRASRNDIVGLGQPSFCHRYNMIPAGCRRRAVRAASVELFKDGGARRRRDWINPAAASRRAVAPSFSEVGVGGVTPAHIGIGTCSAAAGMDVLKPILATAAPFQADHRLHLAITDCRPWSYAATIPARHADIPASVEAGEIHLEPFYWSQRLARTAHFLAGRTARNKLGIESAGVFRFSHRSGNLARVVAFRNTPEIAR